MRSPRLVMDAGDMYFRRIKHVRRTEVGKTGNKYTYELQEFGKRGGRILVAVSRASLRRPIYDPEYAIFSSRRIER